MTASLVPDPGPPASVLSASGAGPSRDTSKRASQIARAIERDIVSSGRTAGTSLGSETALASHFGVSRTVLREAVRILEHRHVAEMRMGPGGGLTVRQPDGAAFATAAEIYLRFVGTRLDHVLEARRVMEPLAAGLAADAGSEEAVSELVAAVDAEAGWDLHDKTGREQEQLAVRVAAASGNPAVSEFVSVLIQLTYAYASYPGESTHSSVDLLGTAQQTEMGHRAVVAAIAAGDSSAAAFRQHRHLQALEGALCERTPRGPLHVGPSSKLAERTAARIAGDIAADGWPVGQVLGSEAALMAERDVSRAVLREAVRILEHHGIASMRRGRGGGLIVTRPERDVYTEALAGHLHAQRLPLSSLNVARRCIELHLIDLVCARALEDPAITRALQESLEHERRLHLDGRDAFSCDVHAVLAQSCGNPVLALFSSVLSDVWARAVELHDPSFDWCGASTAVVGVHSKIVAALVEGDRDVARRRMAKHLDTLSFWWS